MNLCDTHEYKKQCSRNYAQKANTVIKHIEKIKGTANTKEIHYPEYKNSFDYVDGKFPGNDVKDVTVLLCSKGFLKSLGYIGIGGFFEKILKTVIICDDGPIDETIVHEMLHFVSDMSMSKSYSVGIEEEFAYINSIDYLRQKGRDDCYIMNQVFLPYLMGVVNKKKIVKQVLSIEEMELYNNNTKSRQRIFKKYKSKIQELVRQEALVLAQNLINLHDKKTFTVSGLEIKNNEDFDLMEF